MRSVSKKRIEMGEEAWAEYQQQRKYEKAKIWAAKNIQHVVDWRRRTKFRLIEYKGGKCEKCGYCKDVPGAYDFHHIDPDKKSFSIGVKGDCKSLEFLKKEVDKCILVCRNCHAEIHNEEYKKSRDETVQRYKDWLSTRLQDKNCPGCNMCYKPKRKTQVFCSGDCAKKSRRHALDRNL